MPHGVNFVTSRCSNSRLYSFENIWKVLVRHCSWSTKCVNFAVTSSLSKSNFIVGIKSYGSIHVLAIDSNPALERREYLLVQPSMSRQCHVSTKARPRNSSAMRATFEIIEIEERSFFLTIPIETISYTTRLSTFWCNSLIVKLNVHCQYFSILVSFDWHTSLHEITLKSSYRIPSWS